MARLNVNPTRMELTNLKTRLKTARRGHKLLKDKRDEMMKRFLDIVRQNKDMRSEVESEIMSAHASFTIASAVMSREGMAEALMAPKQHISVNVKSQNIMSVNVPVFEILAEGSDKNIYPYGLTFTSGELDGAVEVLYSLLPKMLRLAELEKGAQLLAAEIEKTRRRVNALEYVVIPRLIETIRYITMKLEENERGNLTRLMKVKDMMLEQLLIEEQLQAQS